MGLKLLLLVPLASCTLITDSFQTNEFSGDEFPILVDTSSGALRLGVRQVGVDEDRAALLDVLALGTLVDPGPSAAPSITTASLTILGQSAPGGVADLPRAVLADARVMSFHPCDVGVAPCLVGPTDAPAEYSAIIGADALAGDAVRLRLGDDQIFILPDIGGDEVHRTRACDGVYPSPFRGGGTLVIGGTEVSFGGRRIALQACLADNPDPALPQGYRGSDTLFVMSTSIGTSLIGTSAYARYLESQPQCSANCNPACDLAVDPSCDTMCDPACPIVGQQWLPVASVNLPSGPVTGRLVQIPRMAIVASSSASRSACRHVYASHFQLQRNCVAADQDCPCEENSTTFCGAPAVVHLEPAAGLPFLVIPDDNDTLQALRTELRPNQAEVDGVLGTSAIKSLELDVDYPHNRLLARCTGDGCITRPQMTETIDRTQARGCLKNTPPGPEFPLP